MAVKYIGIINKQIQYLCASTDTKPVGDIGSRLYTYDDFKHFINTDGTATGWVEFKEPALYSAV
jgi:hypothetical protein